MEISHRGKGRPTEKFGLTIKGLEGVVDFLEETEDELADFVEDLVEETAKRMTESGGRMSIKTTREFSATGGGIPVDTGLLKAVFGAVDGHPNTGYYHKGKKAKREQKLKGRDPAQFVVWEKIGRYQMDIGTTLWYAWIVQQRWDFMRTYLRTHDARLQDYIQGKTNKFINKMGKKYGFKGTS